MITVWHTYVDAEMPAEIWSHYLNKIPNEITERIIRYKRWQDRQAGLFGKLLLIEGLKALGLSTVSLDQIRYNTFGRPFLNQPVDFNITHSGGYILCAVTDKGKVGIDVEKISTISLCDFKQNLRPEEWRKIIHSKKPYEQFFDYWTMKESVVKANGGGLSIPLTDIFLLDDTIALLYGEIWFLKEINVGSYYKCYVATDLEKPKLKVIHVDLKHMLVSL